MEVQDFFASSHSGRFFYECIFSQKCSCNNSTKRTKVGVSDNIKPLDTEEEKAQAMMEKFKTSMQGESVAANGGEIVKGQQELAKKMSHLDWCIFQSPDPEEPLWLGRAMSNSSKGWDNKCTWLNKT